MSEGAQQAILEPDLPIVDPHHHLWDRRAVGAGPNLPPVTHPMEWSARLSPYYMMEELLADLNTGHNIVATVFVQCHSMHRASGPEAMRPVGETEYVNGVAAMSASGLYGPSRICAGIVGHVDLMLGEKVAREALEAHMAAGGGRFRGIRHIGSWDASPEALGALARSTPPQLYRRDDFRSGFRALGQLGLSFDAWLLQPQIDDLTDLARAFPDQPIVLDHVGTPIAIGPYAGQREALFAPWRESIRELATCPNVTVKLGGLAMPFAGFPSFRSDPPATAAQLAAEWKPYLDVCIEAFGAERCMFESNFPVDRGSCDYRTLWNAFKTYAAGFSASEKAALFSGTASRFYRLEP